ncbi:hypothetical protein DEJ49_17270 [Streptomyces venezuelae]|uniref:Uncharacterized protein n=2 Tax=Streptomyces venezuelae TaxID=54571 RepID=A0A5P2CWC1_STRVZ|nr:hypothetical protein DEJ49_17270 [Streptomyces venezuelae]
MSAADLQRGFWCECWAEDLTTPDHPMVKTAFGAYSAAQADGWLSTALRVITKELTPDAPTVTWDWLYESRIDTRRVLLNSEPRTLAVTYAGMHVTWTIRPVLFLPLADHQKPELMPYGAHLDSEPHGPG